MTNRISEQKIVVHPTVLDRLRTEDEKHLIEMEKTLFRQAVLPVRHRHARRAVQVIVNVENNDRTGECRGVTKERCVTFRARRH